MEEIWKDIEGFEGVYKISSKGRLKSYKEVEQGRILKQTNKKGGYFSVSLQKKGYGTKHARIHRLVAEAFIPNPDNLPEVNHIDGNKQNNSVENLEWCSPADNNRHAMEMNLANLRGMIRYNKYVRPKRIVQLSKDGKILRHFLSAAEAQRQTGVCGRNILQVANKTPFNDKGYIRKTAGGYVWRFAEGGE